ncbi:hypothetical protein niasHT_035743 [Heterodera trifolii]|uniref:Uncharacterized protein n=1 Tax=Heterodera trifolii TaxID=157864 RepID=A0ABD2J3H4_9BILA
MPSPTDGAALSPAQFIRIKERMSSGGAKVIPGGVVAVKRFCPRALCAAIGCWQFAAVCCALLMVQGSIAAGMYIKDTQNNEDVLRRHLHFRQQQQPIFALPLDVFDASPTAVIGLKPFAEHLVFEKRFAPREMGKRERIIMDAMGGNDYLIKRSFGRK